MFNNELFGKHQSPGFNSMSFHVGFLRQRLALGQVFVRVFLYLSLLIDIVIKFTLLRESVAVLLLVKFFFLGKRA
jgi:hypothetical protein